MDAVFRDAGGLQEVADGIGLLDGDRVIAGRRFNADMAGARGPVARRQIAKRGVLVRRQSLFVNRQGDPVQTRFDLEGLARKRGDRGVRVAGDGRAARGREARGDGEDSGCEGAFHGVPHSMT